MAASVHPMDQISEKTLQGLVEGYCLQKGLLFYHTYDSRRSVAGYPDLTILGAGGVMLAELKSETGKLSRSQKAWVDAAIASHTPVRIWRPAQRRDGTIRADIDEFAARGNDVCRSIVRRCANALRDERATGAVRRSMRPAPVGGVEQ